MATLLNSSIADDKPDSFINIQMKYFGRILHESETVTLTVEQFRIICDKAHEHGRTREKALTSRGNLKLK